MKRRGEKKKREARRETRRGRRRGVSIEKVSRARREERRLHSGGGRGNIRATKRAIRMHMYASVRVRKGTPIG